MRDMIRNIEERCADIAAELSAYTGRTVAPNLESIYEAAKVLNTTARIAVPYGHDKSRLKNCIIKEYEPCEISGVHTLPMNFDTSDVLHVYCRSNSDCPILTAEDSDTLFYINKDVLSITQEGVTGSEIRIGSDGLFIYNGDAKFNAVAGSYTVNITDGMMYSIYIKKRDSEYLIIPVNGKYVCYKYAANT